MTGRNMSEIREWWFALPTLSQAALGASAGGLIAAVPGLPTVVKAILLGVFVFVGPGSALLLTFESKLPRMTVLTLIPLVGLSVVILVTTASLYFVSLFKPTPILLLLAVATIAYAVAVPVLAAKVEVEGDVKADVKADVEPSRAPQ